MVSQASQKLAPEFRGRPSRCDRPSILPEPCRVLLLQAIYSSRRICFLLEQMQDNLLCGWFGGLALDDPVWDHFGFYDKPRAYSGI